MIKKTILLLSIILTFCAQLTYAQELRASLSHYSTDEGLSSNAISDIIQDKYGYTWISTWNGLCRFDGYSFYNYPTGNRSGIPFLHNRILNITADHEGNIWMRMYDGRIFVLNRKRDMITNVFKGAKDPDEFKTEHAIKVSSSGYAYTIIKGKGVYSMKLLDNKIVTKPMLLTKQTIHCIAIDKSENLWYGSDHGLIEQDHATGKVKGFFLKGEKITCLFVKDNDVYAGTASSKIVLCRLNRQNIIRENVNSQEISSIFIDSYGLIWFSTEDQGISRLIPSTGNIKHFTQMIIVPEYDLHGGTFMEVGGILWARMNKGGFGYYKRSSDTFEYFHNNPNNSWNLSNTLATYLSVSENVVWISTIRRGLEKLEILKERIKRTLIEPKSKDLSANEIRAMYYDPSNQELWIGNKSNGLYIYKKGKLYKHYNCDNQAKPLGRIYGFMRDREGVIWMSTKGNGLYKITGSTKTELKFQNFRHDSRNRYSLSSDNAYITSQDRYGNLWVATYGGGINLMLKNNKGGYDFINTNNLMTNYPRESYNKVRTLAADSYGNIWVGTSDGIVIVNYDIRHKRVNVKIPRKSGTESQQLASNDIVQIVNDGHDVMWIATNGGGLSRTIGTDKCGNILFESFGGKDELPSDEVRSITFDQYGNVWFATDHIICSYDVHKHLFTSLSLQDGVDDTMCSECAAITLNDGKMLFGTLNGYYTVDRKNLINCHASMLKLKITDFFINDELITPRLNDYYTYYVPDSKSVELPSRSSVFSFRFASLNYQLQHRVHYQCLLAGYDKTWHNVGHDRMISYSNIPAGTYEFQVKAFLLESPDKYDIRKITVIVPPYLFASTGAMEIYLVLFIIGIIAAIYYRKYYQDKIRKMRVLKVGPQEIAFKRKDDYDFVLDQLNWLELHYTESNLKIEDMVAHSSLSRTSYYNKLKLLVGLSPKEFISDFRLKKAVMYLEKDDCTIAEIAYRTGFNDPVYFTRTFKTKIGVTPSKYRDEKLDKTNLQEENSINDENIDKKKAENLENSI